jgi:hypothetical protein
MDLEVSNVTIVRGKVDLSIVVYDKHGDSKSLMDKCCVDAWGGQISSIKIRGVFRKNMRHPLVKKTKGPHVIPKDGILKFSRGLR